MNGLAQDTEWRGPFPTVAPAGQSLRAGGYLERNFETVIRGCNLSPSKWVHERGWPASDVRKSTIPKTLQDALRNKLEIPVESQWDRSLSWAFAYIYRQEEREGRPTFEDSRTIRLNLVGNPTSMVPEGVSNVAYAHNCNSLVTQTFKASGGFKLPYMSLQAGLSGEYSGADNVSFSVYEGIFTSPVETMLLRGGTSRLYANLLLWDWYANNDLAPAETAYYLTRYEGLAGAFIRNANRELNGRINVDGSLSAAIVNAEAATALSLQQSSRISVTEHSTAAYNEPAGRRRDIGDYKQMPTLAALVSEINGTATPRLQPGFDAVLRRGGTHNHRQILEGVPQGLCNIVTWDVDSASKNRGVFLTEVDTTAPTAPGIERCEFSVQYKPLNDVFTGPQNRGSVTLTYSLATRRPKSAMNLTIPAQPVEYRVSSSPNLSLDPHHNEGFSSTAQSGGAVQLTWNVRLEVHDVGDEIDWNTAIDRTGTQLTCTDDAQAVLPVSVSVVPQQNQGRTIRLIVQRTVNASEGRDLTGATTVACQLKGTLTFRMQTPSSPPVQKNLEDVRIPLRYPAKTTTPAQQ